MLRNDFLFCNKIKQGYLQFSKTSYEVGKYLKHLMNSLNFFWLNKILIKRQADNILIDNIQSFPNIRLNEIENAAFIKLKNLMQFLCTTYYLKKAMLIVRKSIYIKLWSFRFNFVHGKFACLIAVIIPIYYENVKFIYFLLYFKCSVILQILKGLNLILLHFVD